VRAFACFESGDPSLLSALNSSGGAVYHAVLTEIASTMRILADCMCASAGDCRKLEASIDVTIYSADLARKTAVRDEEIDSRQHHSGDEPRQPDLKRAGRSRRVISC
jgi:hypothetical protein